MAKVRKIKRAILYTSKMRNIKFKIHDTETMRNICLKKLEILELKIKQLEEDFERQKKRFIR